MLLGLLGLRALGAQGQSLDTLQPIEGEAVRCKVQGIDAKGTISLQIGENSATRKLSNQRRIDLHFKSGAPVPRQGLLLLRSGMRIPATVRECKGRKITFDSPLSEGQNTLSLSHLQAIRFAKLEADNDGGFGKYLLAPKEDKDLIYVKNDDKIVQRSVRIVEFADGKVTYEVRDTLRTRKIADLYGIVMAKVSGFAPDMLPRTRVVLAMQGGSFLRGKLHRLDAKFAVLELAEKTTLRVLRTRLLRIDVESDRLIFLTDLEPKVTQVAAFRTIKPWMKNRSPMGDGIMLGGTKPRTLTNGLVLSPKTSLTYDIQGKFDFFVATIGIDARSTGPAHAIFRVLDGKKVLFESKPITRQSEPLAIKVPVTRVKQLTIEADFGKNFDFGDHCVFAEARVIKRGS